MSTYQRAAATLAALPRVTALTGTEEQQYPGFMLGMQPTYQQPLAA